MTQRLTFPRVAALICSVSLVAAYLIFFRPGATAATDPGKDQAGLTGAPSSQPTTKPAQPDTRPTTPMIFMGSKSGAIHLGDPSSPTANTTTITPVQPHLLPGSKSAAVFIPPTPTPTPPQQQQQQQPKMLLGGSKSRAVVDPMPMAAPTPAPASATSKPTTPPTSRPAAAELNK